VHLRFRVYLSRLWFELIADASYGQLLSGLAPCAAFEATAPPKPTERMFTASMSEKAKKNAGYCFTLEGVLKAQEHDGYPLAPESRAGWRPAFQGLFPFQRSTVMPGLGRIVALYYCSSTIFTKIFGASISEATMRPNSRCAGCSTRNRCYEPLLTALTF
jgi:hypothetical protein